MINTLFHGFSCGDVVESFLELVEIVLGCERLLIEELEARLQYE